MTPTPWLDEDQQRAWRALVAVTEYLPSALDAQLQRDAELNQYGYWVLAMLSETPDRTLRMSDLAARSNSSPSRLSHLMTRLESRGWVRRGRDGSDGRGQWAVLTDEGWDKVARTAPGHVAEVRRLVFDGLDADDVAALERISTIVLDRLGGRLP